MYTYNYSYGYSLGYSGGYNPYINYTWEMLPNAKVKNSGTSGVDLQLYSGNPLDFQGSQYIDTGYYHDFTNGISVTTRMFLKSTGMHIIGTLGSSTDRLYLGVYNGSFVLGYGNSFTGLAGELPLGTFANTMVDIVITSDNNGTVYVYFNGSLFTTLSAIGVATNTYSFYIGARNAASPQFYFDGPIDYLAISNRVLTPTEIALSNSNPNAFYESMKNDANTLFCTDFRGTAGYIADTKNNVVTEFANYTFDVDTEGFVGGAIPSNGTVTQESGKLKIEHTNTESVNSEIARKTLTTPLKANTTYRVSAYVDTTQGLDGFLDRNARIRVAGFDVKWDNGVTGYIFGSFQGYIGGYVTTGTTSLTIVDLYGVGNINGGITYYDDLVIQEVSAVYPITNYSATQRTNFTQVNKGLQELMIERDSLGFFLGLREFPKGNGVGYGDTGWIFPKDSSWTLEIISFLEKNTADVITGDNKTYFGCNFATNYLSYVFGVNIYSGSNFPYDDYVLQHITYNHITGIAQLGFNAGNYKSEVDVSSGTAGVSTATILKMTNIIQQNVDTAKLKKFIVHKDKVLTQEEITKNYNDYVAQGLLQ